MSGRGATVAATVAAPLLVGFGALLLWQVLVTVNEVPAYLVPSPLLVAQTLGRDCRCCSCRAG